MADKCKKVLPSPLCNPHASFVDTTRLEIPLERLDPQIVKWIARTSKKWGFKALEREMKKYP